MTVAAFMDLALYDPEHGYYARAARRSGRAGDFFTSVDVGPIFGDLLEIQIAEMLELLQPSALGPQPSAILDLVEAGAGNGRLAADILRAMRDIQHRDIVILLRSMKVKADQFAEQLRLAGVPVHSDSGTGFFESMEVRDILSLLRLLDNQRQDVPMAAVLRSPLVMPASHPSTSVNEFETEASAYAFPLV